MMFHLQQAVCRFIALLAAIAVLVAGYVPAGAQGLPLIRDAEIEGLMRLYTRPVFKAAGINPKSVRVYLIADRRINAFVSGGQRIFIHTGLLTQAKTPNEVIGVLAHETTGGRAIRDKDHSWRNFSLLALEQAFAGVGADSNGSARFDSSLFHIVSVHDQRGYQGQVLGAVLRDVDLLALLGRASRVHDETLARHR